MTDLVFRSLEPSDPSARDLLRRYLSEVAERYYRRPVSEGELDNLEIEESSDDLRGHTGFLLVASRDGEAVGCGGVRIVDSVTGELTRIFSIPEARGTGVGRACVLELEERARARGIQTLRLDTRSDLVEARALYSALGYSEVEAFNDDPYAQHWFSKDLLPRH
ncbi:GNAT family N-acetyltransferase [Glaciihabitans arcticus]|uniref:GNAT family N-acetyltransferase n=1 Tax=Glaciihabitans arcticus TaxID=2668039 RepID=A0A4Q9GUP8_9MICO|nr:GNAT family N-acetyltransferase [Glaciihabitans arcticus]TBN56907.1 GNAT family N-acetyltransferase [Glaciihabitans arcticus]